MTNTTNVLGWYGHSNCGDESYKISFPKVLPTHNLHFTDGICPKADLTILGGGNVFSNHFLNYIEKADSEKKMAMSVSLTRGDPLHRLNLFSDIYVRDTTSIAIAEEAGFKATFLPDFAFALTPDRANGEEVIRKVAGSAEVYEKRVGIVINKHLIGGQEWKSRDQACFDKMVYDLSWLIDNTCASFFFIPFSTAMPWDDRISNGWLADKCKFWKKNVVIYDSLDPQSTLDLISAMDVVVSTRLHSSIFSCIAGVPFIDLTHHDKNLQFMRSIYREQWSISYWHFNLKGFRELLELFLASPIEVRDELLKIASNYRQILEGVRNVHLP